MPPVDALVLAEAAYHPFPEARFDGFGLQLLQRGYLIDHHLQGGIVGRGEDVGTAIVGSAETCSRFPIQRRPTSLEFVVLPLIVAYCCEEKFDARRQVFRSVLRTGKQRKNL